MLKISELEELRSYRCGLNQLFDDVQPLRLKLAMRKLSAHEYSVLPRKCHNCPVDTGNQARVLGITDADDHRYIHMCEPISVLGTSVVPLINEFLDRRD